MERMMFLIEEVYAFILVLGWKGGRDGQLARGE